MHSRHYSVRWPKEVAYIRGNPEYRQHYLFGQTAILSCLVYVLVTTGVVCPSIPLLSSLCVSREPYFSVENLNKYTQNSAKVPYEKYDVNMKRTHTVRIATGEVIRFDFPNLNERFDEHTTAARFHRIATDNGIASGDKPSLRYGNMELYEKCEGNTDLRFFINLFLEGGNNVSKILARAGASDAEVIRKKCAAYDIETESTQDRSKVLTLARIARAFTVHTAREILKTNSKGILTTSNFFKQELPLVMQHQIFSGLIPVTQFTDDLKKIALILNVEISLILESPQRKLVMKNGTVEYLVNSSVRYVDAAINAKIYDDADKLKILAEAGILNAKDNGEFELSSKTVELINQLPAIEAVYSLPYSDAVRQLKSK